MTISSRRTTISLITVPAIALAAAAHAQPDRQAQQQQQQKAQVHRQQSSDDALRNWESQRLYRNTWRPWRDLRISADMQYVQVPLREVENGTYSLHGRIPQGEDVGAAVTSWRVNELIGDYASLEDNVRYGLVRDVIFNDQAEAQGIIVQRGAGPWGRGGWYGYPFYGFSRAAYAYPLPYRTSQVGEAGRFDYIELAEKSRYSSGKSNLAQQQARTEAAGAASGPHEISEPSGSAAKC